MAGARVVSLRYHCCGRISPYFWRPNLFLGSCLTVSYILVNVEWPLNLCNVWLENGNACGKKLFSICNDMDQHGLSVPSFVHEWYWDMISASHERVLTVNSMWTHQLNRVHYERHFNNSWHSQGNSSPERVKNAYCHVFIRNVSVEIPFAHPSQFSHHTHTFSCLFFFCSSSSVVKVVIYNWT